MFQPKLPRLSNAQNQIHFRKKKLECIWEALVRSRTHQLIWEKSGSHKALLVLTWIRLNLARLLSLVLTWKRKKKPKISILGTAPECKQRGTGPSGCLWQVYICNTGHTSLKPNKAKTKTSPYICNMYHPNHLSICASVHLGKKKTQMPKYTSLW